MSIPTFDDVLAAINAAVIHEVYHPSPARLEQFRLLLKNRVSQSRCGDEPAVISSQAINAIGREGGEIPESLNPGTVRKYMREIDAVLAMEPKETTGQVIAFKNVTGAGEDVKFGAVWVNPDTDVPDHRISEDALVALLKRLQIHSVQPPDEPLYPAFMMSLAHVDASLYPHLPMPSLVQHEVALRKMKEAPWSYTLLVADERRDADERAALSDNPMEWIVHAYCSLWRCPADQSGTILNHLRTHRNPSTILPHSDELPGNPPIEGVFTAIRLASYLRSPVRTEDKSRRARRLQTALVSVRHKLIEAVLSMLLSDAIKGIRYRSLVFILTHQEDAQFIRQLDPHGAQCAWLPRSSSREIPVRMTLMPWRAALPQIQANQAAVAGKAANDRIKNLNAMLARLHSLYQNATAPG